MHASVLEYVRQTISAEDIAGRRVLEVGAGDVNGSVRPDLERLGPSVYVGVDAVAGPRVDRIVDATRLYAVFGRDSWDVVISTEMLEHARDWRGSLANMVSVLCPRGLLLVTTRSPGFPYHGFPEDHWRFPVELFGRIIAESGLQQLNLVPDWEAPGVFCKARKPSDWSWPIDAQRHLWAGIDVPRAPRAPTTSPQRGTERNTTMAKEPVTTSPQAAGQLRQLLAERENAEAYGQTTRLEAVDKQLAELGYSVEKSKVAKAEAAKSEEKPSERAPQGRATRQEQQQATVKKAD